MSIAGSITKFNQIEIKFLFDHADRCQSCSAFVLLRTQKQSTIGRILVVLSKKIGNAPSRNLLKRRVKAIFMAEKGYEKGFDWVLIARKKATLLSFANLQKKLQSSFATL